MINEKCVLILGAGASAPYGFPTGKELKNSICTRFESMWEKFVWEKSSTPFTDDYLSEQKQIAIKFINDFKRFDHDSIDLFLDIFKEHTDIGKKAIYLTILQAEKINKSKGIVQEWYSELFRLMLGTSDNYFSLSENNLDIITFNYDRSLEYYFYNILNNFTNSIPLNEKIEELRKIKIHHVYGKLADLPWQSDTQPLEYGKEIWLNQLEERKNNIKTIYERTTNKKDFEPIANSITLASKLYYLGFGFARENVEIISLNNRLRAEQIVYVSDFDNRKVRVENQMRASGTWHDDRTFIIEGSDCKRIIEDYLR